MPNIHHIALKGGPSGGKSTLQRAISEQLPQAYCVPEVATLLLSGGFPAPNEQDPWDQDWQNEFQKVVAATQDSLESISARRAQRRGASCIVYDRGLPDGAAYLPRGMRDLEEHTGLLKSEMLSRYDTVMHLPSSASMQKYDKSSNPHRFEEAEAALERERKTLEIWQEHPNRIIVDAVDKRARIAQGLSIIRDIISA